MKVVAIVQARMGSTRLPGKTMLPICGVPMLAFLLRRLKRAHRLDGIIVATSAQPGDDAISALCADEGVGVFRGSEEDVLGRFQGAAAEAGADVIVRVTADNPLVDPAVVDRVVAALDDPAIDHVSTFAVPSYPYGVGCAAMRRATLDLAAREARSAHEREHVEPYLLASGQVRTLHLDAPPSERRPEISVTVDRPVDLEKVSRAASALVDARGMGFTTRDVIDWFDHVPLLVVANGRLGRECVRFLRERGERICGLVVAPAGGGTLQDEIVEAAAIDAADVLSPPSLKAEAARRWIAERRPELIASFWSRYIFPPDVIAAAPRGITNLHNSLLPWARGGEANIWTIIDGHEAGVTLHYVTPEIDAGPVIAQRGVPCHSWDTGRSLFQRLEEAMIDLFRGEWDRVRVGPVFAEPQPPGGSYHGHRAADALRTIDLDKTYRARDLIDLLRALSFPPYAGAHFIDEHGNKIDVRLVLERIGGETGS